MKKFEKADNYTFSGNQKYESIIHKDATSNYENNNISVKKVTKDGATYKLIKKDNEQTRKYDCTAVDIMKKRTKDDYFMLISATQDSKGLFLQQVTTNSTVSSNSIGYSSDEITEFLKNNFYFQEERMSDFFDVNLKEKNNNKIITIKVKDTKKLDKERIKDGKKKDPNYDPYMLFENKVSKSEIKKHEVEFVLDQNNNLTSQKVNMLIDYGDGLKIYDEFVKNFTNINSTTLDTSAIDALCEHCAQAKDLASLFMEMKYYEPIN